MPGDILDLIDNALEDYSASPDAMRWRPEGSQERERPSGIPDWAREGADLDRRGSLPTWRPGIDTFPASGQLNIWPSAITSPVASVPVGAILTVDGTPWRVARIDDHPDGGRTFYLEPPELALVQPGPGTPVELS